MGRSVRKVVMPVAGLGTRMLPATKVIPKEMMPILDRPIIEYAVEECISSGIDMVIMVTGRYKRTIEDHFDLHPELEVALIKQGKEHLLGEIKKFENKVNFVYVRQNQQLGLGHAVLCAREVVGCDDFAVILTDDLIISDEPAIGQLIKVYEELNTSVVALKEVPWESVERYGIVKAREIKEGVFLIEDMVEKPKREDAPSNLAIIGRYVLKNSVLEKLVKTRPGKGGEIQLTDALKEELKERPIYGVKFKGTHFDCGNKEGFILANIFVALKDEHLRKKIIDTVKEHIR